MHLENTKCHAPGLTLPMGVTGIVDFTAGAPQFTTDLDWRPATAHCAATDAALIVAHGHDDGLILELGVLVKDDGLSAICKAKPCVTSASFFKYV